MSNKELDKFLGVKTVDMLNTDQVTGGKMAPKVVKKAVKKIEK